MKERFIFCCAVYLVIGGFMGHPGYCSDVDTVPNWCAVMGNHVKDWYESEAIVGAELLIIVDDKPVVHHVWGWDDREDNRTLQKNKIFRLRSMTKPFIGTSILMLEESGQLSLDSHVYDYLPSFDNPKSKNITLRHLLYHTSGFSMGYPRGSIDDYSNLEEAVADSAEKGPKYEPGTEYHYADVDSAALGLIIKKVTGESPEDFIRKKILEPLSMKDTYCLLEDGNPDRSRVCSTYLWKNGGYIKLWDNDDPPETLFFRCSGGMYGTAMDYAKFLKMWMHFGRAGDKQFLKKETVLNALKPGNLFDRYGMHWEIYHPSKSKDKLPVFGHGGSDGTLAMAIPKQNAMVFYFTQSRGTLSTMFFEKLLLQELGYIKGKEFPDITISEKLIKSYLGAYQMGKEVWTVKEGTRGILYSVDRLVPLQFLPVSETHFVHPVLDMSVTFQLNEDGSCDSLIFKTDQAEVPAKRCQPEPDKPDRTPIENTTSTESTSGLHG